MTTEQVTSSRIQRHQQAVSEALAESGLSPLLQRLYANRNIQHPDELDYSLNRLIDYRSLKGIDVAAALTADAIESESNIIIIGDYDADGATSTAVIMRAMKMMGHRQYQHLVPNRFDFGYGLSPEIVDVAMQFQPDMIITVDNGIASVAGVARANELGVPVVVTDHHLAGDVLPDAEAIVNPNQAGCEFPSKVIAGVGVAFYLMLAVRAELRERGWFEDKDEPNMAALLDLVALGTVADVVPLDHNNRVLVDQGLRRIRAGKCCEGIRALMQVAGKNISSISSQDFGFTVGPRLNAAGRLEDMSLGIECLVTDDAAQASEIATMLDSINKQRRVLEADMLQQANGFVDEQLQAMDESESLPAALCLYRYDWHQGIVGLLASRIKERVHRPVIAFADATEGDDSGETIKGSARSIPGIHIRDMLDRVDRKRPGIIVKFGGHAMAAGLTLRTDALQSFEQALQLAVQESTDAAVFDKTIETDGSVDSSELNLASAEALRYAGPWGQQFREPQFDDAFEVLDWRIVGEKHLKLRLRQPGGSPVDAIAFNHTDADLPAGDAIRAAYRMDVNEYNGRRSLQLIIEHIQEV